MNTVVHGVLLVTFLMMAARPATAQPETWSSLAVPSAAFEIAGVSLQDDRAQLMLRLIRRIHSVPDGVDESVDLVRRQLSAGEAVPPSPAVTQVPLPLPPQVWSEVILPHQVPPRVLFSAIIRDRKASLLYYGLCALTPETREFLRSNPDLLRSVYRERAGTLAAYGSSLRVLRGSVDLPGGDAARPLWEALVGEPAAKPAEFIERLLGRDDGRLAYLYQSIDALDSPHQRFALGLTLDDAGARVDRLKALYRAFTGIEAEWSQWAVPFARPMFDAGTLLQIARVRADGALAGPSSRRLWRLAFESTDLPDDPRRAVRDLPDDGALDSAGLAELVALAPAKHRRERFEAFAFGQRVFGDAKDEHMGDVLVALRAFRRFPALMLILDRLGITSPAVYASMARHAVAIERIGDPRRQIPLQAQFQGVLAAVDRLTRTGRLDGEALERLLAALAAITPDDSAGYRGRVAAWIQDKLLPAMSGLTRSARVSDHDVVAALADSDADGVLPFQWEGLAYQVSIALSERRRIEAIRAKQRGNSLDAVLAFSRDVAALEAPTFAIGDVKAAAASLRRHATTLAPGKAWPGMRVEDVPDIHRRVEQAVEELEKIKRPHEIRRARRIGAPLVAAADYLLGEILIALAYAPVLGDPDNLVGGEADVAHRHDFAVGTAVIAEARTRGPWLRPQRTGPTVVGAALGLDLVLASRALRRLATDRVPQLPRLKENDREVFAASVALMNPRRLNDADLSRLATAVREGRRYVVEAGSDITRLEALAAAAQMSASRRQLLSWAATHDPARVPNLFSIAELLEIGDSDEESAWRQPFGLAEEPLTGCYCIRFPSPGPWEVYSGRPGTGQLATRVPDLTLRIVELLYELQAPAVLLPWVLSLATQDFIHEVPALYGDDWAAAIAYAQTVSRERVEDYIASLTAAGPLRPAASNPQ